MLKCDYWYGDKHEKKKYFADAYFTPSGGYSGNIYDDCGKMIGDYHSNNSLEIEKHFLINWKE